MKYLFLHCEGMTRQPTPGIPTAAEITDTPLIDMLCRHAAIGTVMPHNPALKRFPGDTTLALLSYSTDRYSPLFDGRAEEESVTEETYPRPLSFQEKWNVVPFAFTSDPAVSRVTEALGMATTGLPVDENERPRLAASVRAVLDAGYNFVYCYLPAGQAEYAWLDSELATLYRSFVGTDDTLSFLLVAPEVQTAGELPRPCPYLLFPVDEGEVTAPRFTERYAESVGHYLARGRALIGKLFDKEPNIDPAEAVKPAAPDPVKKKAPEEEAPAKPPKAPVSHSIFELLRLFAFSLAAVLVLMMTFVRHSPVNGPSMMPTLNQNEILLITGHSYAPAIGDIVIVQTAKYNMLRPLVKRVIATGGDRLRINFDTWEVFVNDQPVDQSYLKDTDRAHRMELAWVGTAQDRCHFTQVEEEKMIFETVVPENKIFIMGDNRQNSTDSRTIGFVDEREIVGKVSGRLFPLNKIGDVE